MIHLDLKLPHVRRLRWLPRMAAAQQLNCRSTFWGLAFRAATNANIGWIGHFCVLSEWMERNIRRKKRAHTEHRCDTICDMERPTYDKHAKCTEADAIFMCALLEREHFPNRISRALLLKRCQMNNSGDGSCVSMFSFVKFSVSWSDRRVARNILSIPSAGHS